MQRRNLAANTWLTALGSFILAQSGTGSRSLLQDSILRHVSQREKLDCRQPPLWATGHHQVPEEKRHPPARAWPLAQKKSPKSNHCEGREAVTADITQASHQEGSVQLRVKRLQLPEPLLVDDTPEPLARAQKMQDLRAHDQALVHMSVVRHHAATNVIDLLPAHPKSRAQIFHNSVRSSWALHDPPDLKRPSEVPAATGSRPPVDLKEGPQGRHQRQAK